MNVPTKRLTKVSRERLVRHFLKLTPEDVRLRFGGPHSPEALRSYVESIDFDHDAVFGVFEEHLELVGVAHVARMPGDAAEFGVSVLPGHRGHGIGTALFARANDYARNLLTHTLFMHCLTENAAMMHIARKSGMSIVCDAGEADAYLELPPADAGTIARELMDERVALFDVALKAQVAAARRFAAALGNAETPNGS